VKFLNSLVYGNSFIKLTRTDPIDISKLRKQSMDVGTNQINPLNPRTIKNISVNANSILANSRAWKVFPLFIRLQIPPLSIFKKLVSFVLHTTPICLFVKFVSIVKIYVIYYD
jgi:hypothetical protein